MILKSCFKDKKTSGKTDGGRWKECLKAGGCLFNYINVCGRKSGRGGWCAERQWKRGMTKPLCRLSIRFFRAYVLWPTLLGCITRHCELYNPPSWVIRPGRVGYKYCFVQTWNSFDKNRKTNPISFKWNNSLSVRGMRQTFGKYEISLQENLVAVFRRWRLETGIFPSNFALIF